MKEFHFSSRREYANYMALMQLAHEESVPHEFLVAEKDGRYKTYLRYYFRSLLKGYPKNIIISDYFTRL